MKSLAIAGFVAVLGLCSCADTPEVPDAPGLVQYGAFFDAIDAGNPHEAARLLPAAKEEIGESPTGFSHIVSMALESVVSAEPSQLKKILEDPRVELEFKIDVVRMLHDN